MILNNKSTNPIGYTVSLETDEQRKKIEDDKKRGVFNPSYNPPVRHIAVFPGITGNHPKELLKHASFMADTQVEDQNYGIQIIDQDSPVDATRAAMNVGAGVKLPDFDVVQYCTRTDGKVTEKKQLRAIENIFKLPTLKEIKNQEKRANFITKIDQQFKAIETSIRKDAKEG